MEDAVDIFFQPSIEIDSGEEYFEDDFETLEVFSHDNWLPTVIDRNLHQSSITRPYNHIINLEAQAEQGDFGAEERRYHNRISQNRRISRDFDLNVFPSNVLHDMFLLNPPSNRTIETNGVGSPRVFMDEDIGLGLALDADDRRGHGRDNRLEMADLVNFSVMDSIESDYLESDIDDGLDFQLALDLDRETGSFEYEYGIDDLILGGALDWRVDDFNESERNEAAESIFAYDDAIEIVRSESDLDFNDQQNVTTVETRSGSVDLPSSNWDSGDFALPCSFQSLHVEEEVPIDLVEDFEWEEIGQTGSVRTGMDLNDDDLFHPATQPMVVDFAEEDEVEEEEEDDDDDEDDDHDDELVRGSMEWNVLFILNNMNPGSLHPLDDDVTTESFLTDEFIDPFESGEFFGQLRIHTTPIYGRLPASRSVVEELSNIVVTERDITNNDAVCPICKDDVSVGVSLKQLPCKHHFHDVCILPWLSMRNTCPVCRYELSTDNSDYEDLRERRETTPTRTTGGGGGHRSRIPFELFPEN